MSTIILSKYNAIVIHEKDNVATALQTISKGEKANFLANGKEESITVKSDIPYGHKLGLLNISNGNHIIKYGEVIGESTTNIKEGEHVHIHNIESLRARGDKK